MSAEENTPRLSNEAILCALDFTGSVDLNNEQADKTLGSSTNPFSND